MLQDHLEGLKTQIAEAFPQSFHSLALVWGPTIYMSHKFLGNAGAVRSSIEFTL